MNVLLELLGLAACVAASAAYSGSEIGFYSLTKVQVDLEADRGARLARLVRWLAANDSALLVTILVGNNVALELATHLGHHIAVQTLPLGSPSLQALAVTLVLTPVVFLFGEALPKDLFRRRPAALTRQIAPFILVSRVVYWPLERVLRLVTLVLEKVLGVSPQRVGRLGAREALAIFLAEGTRHGALPVRAEELARNALRLRSIPVRRAMVPWDTVLKLERGLDPVEAFERVRTSRYSRLVVLDAAGEPEGYVHQLELLQEWVPGEAPPDVFQGVRPLDRIAADLPVDKALLRLQGMGRRLALVEEDGAPVGLVSLKDLLEEISGDLAGL